MKLLLVLVCVGAVSCAGRDRFWETLTPEQRQLAGVATLTEEQRAALNALADRFVETQTIHAVSDAQARTAAEVKAKLDAEKKARIGFDNGPAPTDTVRARIMGEFRGWQKGSVLRLDNGQTWVVEDSDIRAFPLRRDPEVEVRPAAFGTWKLFILPEGLWVRVKRVK